MFEDEHSSLLVMFEDRVEAGLLLAYRLKEKKLLDSYLFAIPRGGIVVGETISKVLNLPFAPFIVKKIGAPHNPELAIGAISETGDTLMDDKLIKHLKISQEKLKKLVEEKRSEVVERQYSYGSIRPNLKGATTIIVDDGVATGATVTVAALSLRKLGAKKMILATPVIAKDTKQDLKRYFDEIISIKISSDFHSVGQFYKDFPQVKDSEVLELLKSDS